MKLLFIFNCFLGIVALFLPFDWWDVSPLAFLVAVPSFWAILFVSPSLIVIPLFLTKIRHLKTPIQNKTEVTLLLIVSCIGYALPLLGLLHEIFAYGLDDGHIPSCFLILLATYSLAYWFYRQNIRRHDAGIHFSETLLQCSIMPTIFRALFESFPGFPLGGYDYGAYLYMIVVSIFIFELIYRIKLKPA
jgi:hypothetical protein